MFWKKAGPVCIVATALGVMAYAQTTKPRARSSNLQGSSGYLGVGVMDVTPEIAKEHGLKTVGGVLVSWVNGEPAARAGIHENDVILEFNGQKVNSESDFTETIVGKAPGTKVNLTILRGDTKQNVVAVLGTRPLGLPLSVPVPPPGITENLTPDEMRMAIAAANAVATPLLGFGVTEMSPQLAAFFSVHHGVLVETVDTGLPADKAGLKAGDIITKVNGLPITAAREIMGIVRQAGSKNISFTVVRNKKVMTLSLELVN
ncbi:MAG TPA: PDZ domain-containing protein [Bryobacteraceae bacterium]|jgi:serine protease Do